MIVNSRRRLFRMVIPKYPAFNIYSHIARKTTALGPICIATVVSRLPGWDVEVIDENNYRFPGPLDENNMPDHAALQELRPADAVGFYGGLTCTIPRLLDVARFYREAGVFTVGGSYHLDALPEEALRGGVDVVVSKEGEDTIAELLTARFSGGDIERIQGIALLKNDQVVRTSARPLPDNFDHFPLPDFGLLRYAKVSVYPISRIRGCAMNCEFCSVKGGARCGSPERLMAQIAALVECRQAREFFVVDDQFAQDRRETMRFCKMLADYKQRTGVRIFLTIQIRLDCARDQELLDAMWACGIRNLAIGIETPIDEELRAMGKHLKAADMVALARRYRKHGFLIHGMFIFGYPMRNNTGFTMGLSERVKRFRKFIRQARLDTVQVLLPVPLPGTEFRARLEQQGRVFSYKEVGWEYYDGNFPLIVPDAPLTPEDLQAGNLRIMGKFYRFRRMPSVIYHTLRFPLAMAPFFNVHTRWRKWYRRWRNAVIGSVGYFIIKNWRKEYAKGSFQKKLARAKAVAVKS